MDLQYIEAEIQRHLKVMPDVAKEILEETRRQLIELNRDVEDPELMRRPLIVWMDRVTYRLRVLSAMLPKSLPIQKAIQQETKGTVDPYTYSILREMYELGK